MSWSVRKLDGVDLERTDNHYSQGDIEDVDLDSYRESQWSEATDIFPVPNYRPRLQPADAAKVKVPDWANGLPQQPVGDNGGIDHWASTVAERRLAPKSPDYTSKQPLQLYMPTFSAYPSTSPLYNPTTGTPTFPSSSL